ncbi:MAG: helix-turn-helix domain-containing protein [Alphaproteobacteria bacterium]
MDSGDLAPTGSVAALRFDDPDHFTHAIRGASVEYVPLGEGRFNADLTFVTVDRVRVQRSHIPPTVARGAIDAASAILLFSITPSLMPVVNGATVDEAHVAVLPPGSELHAIVRPGLCWASIALDPETMEEVSEFWDRPVSTCRAASLVGFGDAAVARLRRAVSAIADLGEELPHLVQMPEVARAMGKSIVDLVASVRTGSAPENLRYRRTAEVVRVIKAAEDYLIANVSKPIYSDDLCRALGISLRKLHMAFVAGAGVSPQAYLKFRRLLLVRRALRSGGVHASLVKSAALSHGFWHLGNFARDYRSYFGESPSETLRRAQRG